MGVIGTVPLIILFFISISCYQWTTCPQLPSFFFRIIDVIDNTVADNIIFSLIFLTPPLLLSLITYRMKDEVFRAWWNFARWWVPVIIVVTILLENAGSGGGTLGLDQDFKLLVLGIFYSILVIVSLIRIVQAYPEKKGSQS